jgi:hypothetical protein
MNALRHLRVLSCATVATLCTLARPGLGADHRVADCVAANEGAIRLRATHELRQARDQSAICAAPTCPRLVREVCQTRVTELTAAIPTIVLEPKGPSGTDVRQVSVAMDGRPFAARLDGTALDADPGDHVFTLSAPGQPIVERHLLLYEGQKERHVDIAIGAPGMPTGGATFGSRRIIAFTLAGAGVASVVAGSVLGAVASGDWSSAKAACGLGGPTSCSPINRAAVDSDHASAESFAAASTVMFIGGGLLVATGVALFLTGGGHREQTPTPIALTPSVGPGQAAVMLHLTF